MDHDHVAPLSNPVQLVVGFGVVGIGKFLYLFQLGFRSRLTHVVSVLGPYQIVTSKGIDPQVFYNVGPVKGPS